MIVRVLPLFRGIVPVLIGFFVFLPRSAQAIWCRQVIQLKEGWNAVQVRVNPYEYGCDKVFGGGGVDQVTWWNRDRKDDGTGTTTADTFAWYANAAEPNTFGAVLGGESYLVHAVASTNLTLVGTPANAKGKIFLGEANLVGFNVPPVNCHVSCYDYFRYLDGKSDSPYWKVAASGSQVKLDAGTELDSGSQAIWLNTVGSGTAYYSGPLEVSFDTSEKIVSWVNSSSARTLTIKNVTDASRQVTIDLASSIEVPAGQGADAGLIKLKSESIDWSQGYARRLYAAQAFPIVTNLAAGATYTLRLRPNLDAMPATSAGDYLGILKVSDAGAKIDGETRQYGTCFYRFGVKSAGQLAASKSPAGLWVGSVALTSVNRAPMLSSSLPEWDIDRMEDATQPFQFRLIVHVADDGTVKLLKQAFVGSRTADDATAAILTDKATAKAYRAKYGDAKIRRVSSANFPYFEPKAFDTPLAFLQDGGKMSVTVNQDYKDKTNPFFHAFHPDHDNVAFNNGRPSWKEDSGDGTGDYESWTVGRKITLTFQGEDPTGYSTEDWNRTVCGGLYREELTGLTKAAVKGGKATAIAVEGAFRLYKRLDTAELQSGGVVR